MIRTCPAPMVLAASTNSRSRTESTWPRVSRAKIGMPTMPIAIIALRSPGPSVAVIASASTSVGNASSASMNRMMTLSTLPPK